MTRAIKIVGDCFAICDDDTVIAVVSSVGTQWRVDPLVPCAPISVPCFIPLHNALQSALDINRRY